MTLYHADRGRGTGLVIVDPTLGGAETGRRVRASIKGKLNFIWMAVRPSLDHWSGIG